MVNYTKIRARSRGLAVLLLMAAPLTMAQQMDTTVMCDEAAEPVAMEYGNGSSNCSISPAVDTDRFLFSGTIDDLIDITVRSTNTNMDPHYELRDQNNNLVAEDECFGVGCTVSGRIVLPSTGIYFIIINDVDGNETGNYELQLELITPPPQIVTLEYDATVSDTLSPATDMDHYSLDVLAGTTLRLLARSVNTNMDPTIELRDPTDGVILLDGVTDFVTCSNVGCVIDVMFTPAMTGVHSLIIYDNGRNETGNYELSVWCVAGACPNAPAALALTFDAPLSDGVSPALDGDFFTFETNPNTLIGLTARSVNTNMDPTIEIRDASGVLVIDGATDGAQCLNVGCTFSIEFVAVSGGVYSMIVYDGGTNETGNYEVGLWCLLGDCNNDGAGEEDRFEAPLLLHTTPLTGTVSPAIDGDFLIFHGTVGTDLQLNGRSVNTNMDPTVVVRDPSGVIVIDGAVDGAQCINVGCTFSVPFSPAVTGTHTLLIFDGANNETGDYQVGWWCLRGDCDSDGDGERDGDFATLDYGDNVTDTISPAIDSDFFQFNGNIGDEIRLSVLSTNTNMDPTIIVRDPAETIVVDGVVDGASCNNVGCSYSVTLFPAMDGRYTLMMFDNGINETGNFQLGLECVFSPGPDFQCDNLAPMNCGDNCIATVNPLQLDSDGDGFGNICDGDFNNDGNTNAIDLGLMKSAFFMMGDRPEDINGDGVVNVIDLGLLKLLFFSAPGPSCADPNNP